MSAHGRLKSSANRFFFTPESILSIRLATIGNLLTMIYDYVDSFANNKKTVCRQKPYADQCDTLVYGSILRGLHALDLWPRRSFDTINISLQGLVTQLQSLKIFTYPGDRDAYGYQRSNSHHSCDWQEKNNVIAVTLSSMPNPVLESHHRHMQIQREKQDLDNRYRLFYVIPRGCKKRGYAKITSRGYSEYSRRSRL